MNRPKQINSFEVYGIAGNIRAESERIYQISNNLQSYLDMINTEWESNRKQKFIQELEEIKALISSCASTLAELSTHIHKIPSSMHYDQD